MAKLTDKEIREFFKKILDNLNKTIELLEDTNIALNNHEKRLKRLEKQKRKK